MPDISFRPMEREDFGKLSRWLAAPHVANWWVSPAEPAYVEEHYGPSVDGTDPTEHFIIEANGRAIGLIQRYLLDDYPEWAAALGLADAAGIDYLIGEPEFVGRGLGSVAIREFTAMALARYPEASAVVAAPQQANVASWKSLERAGFERTWEGQLESDDPGDAGPAYVYCVRRG